MRNLLGRLNGRSAEELTRIATAWRTPVSATDRAGQVGQLYRALIDPRTVRDVWELLDANEQAMIRLLALGNDTALTLAQLAGELELTEGDARQTATQLYHKGILAREGDDEPLPVGVAPRLFLPRELAQLFRRVQDEIEAGDLSSTPLRALLSLLDDTEIEEASQAWGLKVIPGLREREELSRRLLEQVGDAERVARVASARRRDAAAIWRRLQEQTDGPVPLAEAASAAGLGGRDARQARRLREALAELEQALLVWHTYRNDGSRWLFIPAEIRAPKPLPAAEQPALMPPTGLTIEAPPWRSPFALAWDLLTLLRELSHPHAPRLRVDGEAPRSWQRQLNQRLWIRGATVPPEGYLSFLLALATAEGLVSADGPDDQLIVTRAIRPWRDRSFGEQMARLREHWLAETRWIEGEAREDVAVWGADWRGFRQKLLARLGDLAGDAWYPLDAVAQWLAAADPEMLGTTITVATARHPGPGDELTKRRAIIADVAGVTLATAGDWCGLIHLAPVPRQAPAIRLTADGAVLTRDEQRQPAGDQAKPRLIVDRDMIVHLTNPTPVQVWSVSAFAEPIHLDEVSQYRLTAESVGGALEAGFDIQQVTSFLTRQQGNPLQPEIEKALAEWTRAHRRVRTQRALILTPEEGQDRATIERAIRDAGFEVASLGAELVVRLPAGAGSDSEEPVLAILRGHGFSPRASASRKAGERTTRRA
jgi:hypothetical protein